MDRPYTVALQAGEVLPGPDRIAAECRFISALERALGEPEQVAATLRAWTEASQAQGSEIDRATAAMAVRWPLAYQRAAAAGLQGIERVESSAFQVSLGKPG